ncbi:MAG: hypothetical protein GFH27_549409n18 [Chloroflexi bacterium AL-W]|nr:hypothetical protein [Chloroflexi bacterium AL-N1]NOK71353.1 hypothetical protein [Chloroflexi bacterium AL-N10]NOK78756.1 hypothetical protein [Chloroflexi bacterium AL-N5]NOK86126.1 hypothetical protein [Chloroflexi bacterium AL-W]NOK93079.1 hypothetical protein [Chloroflexi bacterium AL-N15]
MNKLLIGVASGTVALAIAGGAVFASSSTTTSNNDIVVAQATAEPEVQSEQNGPENRGTRQGPGRGQGGLTAAALVNATAEVTGLERSEVVDAIREGNSMAQVAEANGSSSDAVLQAARENAQERLDEAIANGRITQEQADAALEQFDTQAPEVINDTELAENFERSGRRGRGGQAKLVQTTAEVSGLTAQEVVEELRSGKSMAQVAEENGSSADAILAELRADGETRLDEMLEQAEERINETDTPEQP